MKLFPETYGQAQHMLITAGPEVNTEELGHWYSPARVSIFIEAERDSCASILALSRSEASLMAGEMSAREWRTLSAVLTALQGRMRSTRGE